MEDYIYHLEDELARTCRQLEGAGPEILAPERLPTSIFREADETGPRQQDSGEHEELMRAPDVELGDESDDLDSLDDSLDQELPSVELPTIPDLPESNDDFDLDDVDLRPEDDDELSPGEFDDLDSELYELLDSDPDLLPDGASRSRDTQTDLAADEPIDAHITHIVFNQRRTGGADLDGRPGDDGLSVVLEPRNADGKFVPLAGQITVVVLDPQIKGDGARVARWQVDSVEAASSLFVVGPNRGIHLDLPWEDKPPVHARLHLFARYETADGRRVVADQQITIDRPDELSSRWTPSTRFSRQQRRLNSIRGQLADDPLGRGTDKTKKTPHQQRLLVETQQPDRADNSTRPPAPASPIPAATPRLSDRPRTPGWRPYR